MCDMINLPVEFKKRMCELLGDEFPLYEKSLSDAPQRAFRVNTDKITTEEFLKINPFGGEKIPYVENGFYFDFDKIGNHPYHHAGMIYVQEPAAMAPAECIDINPDWKILDMCAAPGGKSVQLKNKLGPNGILVSNEIIPSRCKILTGNIERLGLKNCVTTCMDTKFLTDSLVDTFDLIMVDAPCSGEGMFRKEEIAVAEWSLENVKKCAQRQTEILNNAVTALKSGGYIIYATCTFSLEENEMVIDRFLSEHPDFEILPVKGEIIENSSDGIFFNGCECQNINYARRFYPHKNRGEGQFMAVLHNTDEYNGYISKSVCKPLKIDNIVFDFLDDTIKNYSKDNIFLKNGNLYYFIPDFSVDNLKCFSNGVAIGELRKNYILPHHQFFMAFGSEFKRKIELSADSEDIHRYLKGEEISADCENGWAVVMVDGCAVGGAKVVSGVAKNHYPKGLRIKA